MKTTTDFKQGIPTTAQILRYLIRVLGLPIKGAVGYKDLQRLESGGLSPEKIMEVLEAVFDHLWSLGATGEANGSLDAVRDRFEGKDEEAKRWRYDAEGRPIFGRTEWLREFLEFLHRNDALRRAVGPAFVGRGAVFIWLRQFVIPFWAANLAEYYHVGIRWDRGMPGGRFWFLPQVSFSPVGASVHKTPVNLALAWWQDILGRSLEHYADELCGKEAAPDAARRQIQRWLTEENPPGFDAIERWTRRDWNYDGAFTDDLFTPLAERWKRAREFLARKGMIADLSWQDKSPGLPGEEVVRSRTRGEPLELEIPPFAAHPFAAFFESPDPVAAGLPVIELLSRISERWSAPSRNELRLRLLLAGGVHRAWRDATELLGPNSVALQSNWFQSAYNHLLQAHREVERPDERAMAEWINRVAGDNPLAHGALIWVYSLPHWQRLPALMLYQLRSEGR